MNLSSRFTQNAYSNSYKSCTSMRFIFPFVQIIFLKQCNAKSTHKSLVKVVLKFEI